MDKLKQLQLQTSIHCFFTSINAGPWYRALVIQNNEKIVVQSVEFLWRDSMMVKPLSDLEGNTLGSFNLDWAPFITLENCTDEQLTCNALGMANDVAILVGNHLNFTISHFKDANGNWGLTPVAGFRNLSREWAGVLGLVVTGDFPMSLNSWRQTIDRHTILDFVPFSTEIFALALTPQQAEIDAELFLRPFTNGSMKSVLLCIGLFVVLQSVLANCQKDLTQFTGHRIFKTTMWLFFLLVHSYYSGAMTMFFSTDPTKLSAFRGFNSGKYSTRRA